MKKPIAVSVIAAATLLGGEFLRPGSGSRLRKRLEADVLPVNSRPLRERLAAIHHVLSEGLR